MTTLISKTTSPFCHEWQRLRVSSRHLICTGWASISIILSSKVVASSSSSSSSALETSRVGEGEVLEMKPPTTVCRHAIRPTWMFTWYSSVKSVSRRASMRWSYAMIASRITPPAEVMGAEVDGAERVRGAAVPNHLEQNCSLLRLTVAVTMAHITWKRLKA